METPNRSSLPKGPLPIRPILVTGFALTVSGVITFLMARGMDPSPWVTTPILLLTLVNINIILVVVLILLLSRNFIKFFFEKREGGSRFKTKLVAAFIGLSLIPSVLLFIVASGLLTSSIESGLSVEVERSLDASLNVAQDYYAQARESAQSHARQIGETLRDHHFFEDCTTCLSDFLKKNRLDNAALHFFTSPQRIVSTETQTTDLLSDLARTSDPMLPGQMRTTVITDGQGEIVRVAFALEGTDSFSRILVLDRRIPLHLIKNVETIKMESETYKQLKRFKRPLQGGYILSFLIVVLLIIFAAVWFGFYLARRITVPIEKLAEGTTAVAQGNLDFQIDLTAKDELGVLVASFNKMTRDLKQNREALVRAQKVATWKEVALQMAHEIKNPLTPIQLSTERLRKKYKEHSPEFDQIFDSSTQTIINEVERLVALVNEFSTFARLPPLNLMLQPLTPIVQEVVQLYQSGHKEITFDMHVDETIPPFPLDRDSIKRLWVNLFENAVEAIIERGRNDKGREEQVLGRIEISATYDPLRQKVILTVVDDGVGIAPEDREHIFLPHFSRKKRGTGLGLAIVHRIMVDHGGEIRVSPRKPQGTMFTMTFPVSVQPA